MSVQKIVLIVAALLITVGTGFLARAWLNSQRPQVAQEEATPVQIEASYVLVAQSDIPMGALLTASHMRWQAWPNENLPDFYFVRRQAGTPDPVDDPDLIGAVVRRGITAGEPITKGRTIKSGKRGFLAAVLRPGYRAMAIQVDATSGIAGLVFPGDRVDFILTHSVKRGGVNRKVSETVLTNVRILAIDQTTDDQAGQPRVGKNATVELTPKQAEMLAVIKELGRISLSLRSLAKDEAEFKKLVTSDEPLAEAEPARGRSYTWDTQVSRLIQGPSTKNRQDLVEVLRGNDIKVLSFKKKKK